jgi:hypothetical protein
MVEDAVGYDAICLRNGHDGTILWAEVPHGSWQPVLLDRLSGRASYEPSHDDDAPPGLRSAGLSYAATALRSSLITCPSKASANASASPAALNSRWKIVALGISDNWKTLGWMRW